MTTDNAPTLTEPFDSDAVFNKLADCVNDEIHWNYKPDGYKEFDKWLDEEIEKFRQQAFSAGRLQGLMEMDGAWDFVTRTNPEECEMRDPVSVLRAEYQQPN